MKLITDKQKYWFANRTIKVGESYMFPRFGFYIYSNPSYAYGDYMRTNPFTKSLDHTRFLVKEKVNGFCRGNFENKPARQDAYLEERELQRRDMFEKSILYLFCFIPLVIYNFFARKNIKK